MKFSNQAGGWLSGWTFNTTSLNIGGYSFNQEPIKVLLVSENDHGITLVSGHHPGGEYFMGNITAKFNKTLGAVCEKVNTNDTKDGHHYSCKFTGHKCIDAQTKIGEIHLKGADDNLFHLKIEDLLVQSGSDCYLNVGVQHDPSVLSDFLAIGIATFARSQFLVYDFDTSKIGFGGVYTPSNVPVPHRNRGMPVWFVVLTISIVGLIIGLIVYIYLKLKSQKV